MQMPRPALPVFMVAATSLDQPDSRIQGMVMEPTVAALALLAPDTMPNRALAQADTSSLSGTLCNASSDGIVTYSSDGYESLTADTLTPDLFQIRSYQPQMLATTEQVSVSAFRLSV